MSSDFEKKMNIVDTPGEKPAYPLNFTEKWTKSRNLNRTR